MVVAFVEVLSNPSTSVFKWPTTAGDWKKRGHHHRRRSSSNSGKRSKASGALENCRKKAAVASMHKDIAASTQSPCRQSTTRGADLLI